MRIGMLEKQVAQLLTMIVQLAEMIDAMKQAAVEKTAPDVRERDMGWRAAERQPW
jgi:hypothetical protein